MAEEPQPLDGDTLEGMESIRVGRRMRDPVTRQRTGPLKVWRTDILSIIRFARRVSPTIRNVFARAGRIGYEMTDGRVIDAGVARGPSFRLCSGEPVKSDSDVIGDVAFDPETGDIYELQESEDAGNVEQDR